MILDLEGVSTLGTPFLQELSRLFADREVAFINAGEHQTVIALASARDRHHAET